MKPPSSIAHTHTPYPAAPILHKQPVLQHTEANRQFIQLLHTHTPLAHTLLVLLALHMQSILPHTCSIIHTLPPLFIPHAVYPTTHMHTRAIVHIASSAHLTHAVHPTTHAQAHHHTHCLFFSPHTRSPSCYTHTHILTLTMQTILHIHHCTLPILLTRNEVHPTRHTHTHTASPPWPVGRTTYAHSPAAAPSTLQKQAGLQDAGPCSPLSPASPGPCTLVASPIPSPALLCRGRGAEQMCLAGILGWTAKMLLIDASREGISAGL